MSGRLLRLAALAAVYFAAAKFGLAFAFVNASATAVNAKTTAAAAATRTGTRCGALLYDSKSPWLHAPSVSRTRFLRLRRTRHRKSPRPLRLHRSLTPTNSIAERIQTPGACPKSCYTWNW